MAQIEQLITLTMIGLGMIGAAVGYFSNPWVLVFLTAPALWVWFLWKPNYDPPPGIGVSAYFYGIGIIGLWFGFGIRFLVSNL